jgi:hypothetical protein
MHTRTSVLNAQEFASDEYEVEVTGDPNSMMILR